MKAPWIDKRGYNDLVKQTEKLAQDLSGWKPPPDGQVDAGRALIRVFGRFAELVVDRLNRAPDKNFLAFLNLLGVAPTPPLPARVPLTFQLAEGATVDPAVPAGTQVAAPPLEGEEDEVVFETEQSLDVNRAQLQAVLVSDTRADTCADRTAYATGAIDRPFDAFTFDAVTLDEQSDDTRTVDEPSPHYLYIACDPELTMRAHERVMLLVRTVDHLQEWKQWPITWSWWDGATWQTLEATGQSYETGSAAGHYSYVIQDVPQLTPHTINGVEAGWLRGSLDRQPPPEQAPNSAATDGREPAPVSFPLEPFPSDASRRFYLEADDPFGAGGESVHLRFQFARLGEATDVRLEWSYKVGQDDWSVIGQSGPGADQESLGGDFALRDTTRAFTRNGTVSFKIPDDWPRRDHWTQSGRWLRVTIESGAYSTRPEIADLAIGGLPRVSYTICHPVPPRRSVLLSAYLFYNDFIYTDHLSAALKLSNNESELMWFAPFKSTKSSESTESTEPAAEPALYLGFDQAFGQRPVTVHLQVEPPPPEEVAADKLADVDPATPAEVVWEYANPDGWRKLGAQDGTRALSGRGQVRFVGRRDHAARTFFGQELYWVRARWAGGTFPLPPRLRRVLPNTTWAVQASTVSDEILGSSSGDPDQTFTTAQTPVLSGQQVAVREPERPPDAEEEALTAEEGAGAVTVTSEDDGTTEIWVRWHAVADFYASGPRDRHYTFDPLTGAIRFGDGAHGMVPPPGPNNVRITYRTGGGKQGNRATGTVAELRSSVPYIDSVTNHEPAGGGAAAQPVERVAERGPKVLRHRDRAVTVQDLEDLAAAASPEVARVAAVAPTFNPPDLWLKRSRPPLPPSIRAWAPAVSVWSSFRTPTPPARPPASPCCAPSAPT